MKRVLPRKCFIYDHAPIHVADLKSEHVIMAGSYGIAAGSIHHWLGSVAVAVGYFIVAVIGARENHAQSSEQ